MVDIFRDEYCRDFIGKAELITLIKKGLPVVLDGTSTTIYRFDKWKVRFIDGNESNASGEYYVRFVEPPYPTKGRPSIPDDEETSNEAIIKDRFLKVRGKQIY